MSCFLIFLNSFCFKPNSSNTWALVLILCRIVVVFSTTFVQKIKLRTQVFQELWNFNSEETTYLTYIKWTVFSLFSFVVSLRILELCSFDLSWLHIIMVCASSKNFTARDHLFSEIWKQQYVGKVVICDLYCLSFLDLKIFITL